MGYTTKVLARKRAAGHAEWFLGHCGPERPSQFPIWRFIAMRPRLVRCDWRRRKFQVALDCSGLFGLTGEFRAEGKARRLARRMLDVVGPSLVLVVMRGGRPPQEVRIMGKIAFCILLLVAPLVAQRFVTSAPPAAATSPDRMAGISRISVTRSLCIRMSPFEDDNSAASKLGAGAATTALSPALRATAAGGSAWQSAACRRSPSASLTSILPSIWRTASTMPSSAAVN